MTRRAALLAALVFSAPLLASPAPPPAAAPPDATWVKGRLTGYRGLYPFHVAVLPSRDLADPRGPLAWGTADTETGAFDIPIPSDVEEFYLLGQLDLERQGPRLHAGMLFFLKKPALA